MITEASTPGIRRTSITCRCRQVKRGDVWTLVRGAQNRATANVLVRKKLFGYSHAKSRINIKSRLITHHPHCTSLAYPCRAHTEPATGFIYSQREPPTPVKYVVHLSQDEHNRHRLDRYHRNWSPSIRHLLRLPPVSYTHLTLPTKRIV